MAFISLSKMRDSHKGANSRSFPEDMIVYSVAYVNTKKILRRINITIPKTIAEQGNLYKDNYAEVLYDPDTRTIKIQPIKSNVLSGFRLNDIRRTVKGNKIAGNRLRIQMPYYKESGLPLPKEKLGISKVEIKAGLIFQLPEETDEKK